MELGIRFEFVSTVIGTLAPLIALLIYKKRLKVEDKLFPLMFFLIAFIQLVAVFMANKGIWNGWWYNLTTNVWFYAHTYFLYKNFVSKKLKRALLITAIFNFIFYLYDIIVLEKFIYYASYYVSLQYATHSLFIFLYLKQLSEDITINPINEFRFWYFLGALIDFACCIPYNTTLLFGGSSVSDDFNVILTICFNVWHLLIIFGLIWTYRRDKYSY
jgi:hypothetical protein